MRLRQAATTASAATDPAQFVENAAATISSAVANDLVKWISTVGIKNLAAMSEADLYTALQEEA
jgi:hypothetical protein